MQTAELDYTYPESLVATEPLEPCRILLTQGEQIQEISKQKLFDLFQPGDTLLINNTQVVKRRLFLADDLEILFLKELTPNLWQVLMPARKLEVQSEFFLSPKIIAKLIEKGLPQTLWVSQPLDATFFSQYAEYALPPYIQSRRQHRRNREEDNHWYQSAWAEIPGSCAAPTASLHFTPEDLQSLAKKGVYIAPITLHVGLGTFLPVKSESLADHTMHSEEVTIPHATSERLKWAKEEQRPVWALGTTVTRAVESWALGMLEKQGDDFIGSTDLFIAPGFEFQVVDRLLTNFHQPRSTLLALVAAFTSLEQVRRTYALAVEKKFRLFSYGDLSVWIPC